MMQNDEGTVCALTEQGDLGLGVHKPTDAKEREDLKRRLNEMEEESRRQQQQNQRR